MVIFFLADEIESSFIKTELMHIVKNPKVTRLYLFTKKPMQFNLLWDNVKIEHVDYSLSNIRISAWLNFRLSFPDLLVNMVNLLLRKKLMATIHLMRNTIRKALLIKSLSVSNDVVFYSYWADSNAAVLAVLKNMGFKNYMVTRLHGFDLYITGSNHGYILWRRLIYGALDKLITISRDGELYLNQLYNCEYANKVTTKHLGINIKDRKLNNLIYDSLRCEFHIVSCGVMGKHKNLNGLLQLIQAYSDIFWTHIGDGELYANFKNLISSDNLSNINLIGRLGNADICHFYNDKPITCFISLSYSEGLPVSMMEAMAHGIPVVSTDVGGCSEIVNENTGVLLPKNYTDEDVRKAVYLCAEKFCSREARQKIQDFIKENFDAEKNYEKFVDFLVAENKKHHEKL